ncbi:MAG TPA: hypothetical protein VFH45_04350 [Acidimicrobiales bacterium]|nr:hypothetical protein [Acidimicrobiales bacterium]
MDPDDGELDDGVPPVVDPPLLVPVVPVAGGVVAASVVPSTPVPGPLAEVGVPGVPVVLGETTGLLLLGQTPVVPMEEEDGDPEPALADGDELELEPLEVSAGPEVAEPLEVSAGPEVDEPLSAGQVDAGLDVVGGLPGPLVEVGVPEVPEVLEEATGLLLLGQTPVVLMEEDGDPEPVLPLPAMS